MSNRRLQLVTLAALAAAATLAPASASAQLGKLKKAAADAAKEKAGVKTEAPAAAATGANNFVITADRLAAVMAVMETKMAKAETDAAARAVETDFNTRRKAYEGCIEGQLKAMTGKAPPVDGMQKYAGVTQQTATLGQRLVAAQQAGKHREYVALNDTMQLMQFRSTLIMYNLENKCGAPVYMPPALLDAAAQKMARANSNQSTNSSNEVVVPQSERAGMTTQQFGMVRERAALWALQQTNNAPVGNNKYGVFTNDEQTVLEAQSAKLKKWAPIFKDQPNTWANWGDLKSW